VLFFNVKNMNVVVSVWVHVLARVADCRGIMVGVVCLFFQWHVCWHLCRNADVLHILMSVSMHRWVEKVAPSSGAWWKGGEACFWICR
jgi:hypothetical protein